MQLLQALNESGTRAVPQDAPTGFISDAWWECLLDAKGNLSHRYYVLAVLWELRLTLRSGDIYVEHARRYFGYHRGITFYTWTSNQFSLYGGKAITSTVHDVTYALDEILANVTELPILEHTTDTSGYTEIAFALFDLLGLTFTPRIMDLGDQQLYRTANVDLADLPRVRARLSKRANIRLCLELWDEFLRFARGLKLGWVTAPLAIQRLQASPRESQLARRLQEYGQLTKTLHALTSAIILWNSGYMAEALEQLGLEGFPI